MAMHHRPKRLRLALALAVLSVCQPVAAAEQPVDLLDRPSGGAAATTRPAAGPATRPTSQLPIKVAAILPLSGDMSPFGQQARIGLELAVERANAAGINGRRIQLLLLDTQSRILQAEPLATRAISVDQAEALIGGLDGATALAIRSLAERRRVPFLVLSGGYRFPADASRYTVRVASSDTQLAEAMAGYARQTLNIRRPYVLADVTADQPTLPADRFSEVYASLGGQVVGFESMGPNADVADIGQRIGQARSDAVFACLQPSQLVNLGGAIRNRRLTVPLLTFARFWSLPPMLKPEADSIRPAYLAADFSPDDPDEQVRRFVADLSAKNASARADAVAALAHDAMILLAEAARGREQLGGELRDRLLQVREATTVVGPSGFDDKGEIHKPVIICRLDEADARSGGSKLSFLARAWPVKPAPASQPALPAGK